MNKTLVKIIAAGALVGLLYIVVTGRGNDGEDYLILASALTKLSSAVEATVRYDDPDPNLSDRELIALSTAHDPSLAEPFSRFHLRVRTIDGHAVVLVCTGPTGRAILEDAGWSAELDVHHWRDEPGRPCEFSDLRPE